LRVAELETQIRQGCSDSGEIENKTGDSEELTFKEIEQEWYFKNKNLKDEVSALKQSVMDLKWTNTNLQENAKTQEQL